MIYKAKTNHNYKKTRTFSYIFFFLNWNGITYNKEINSCWNGASVIVPEPLVWVVASTQQIWKLPSQRYIGLALMTSDDLAEKEIPIHEEKNKVIWISHQSGYHGDINWSRGTTSWESFVSTTIWWIYHHAIYSVMGTSKPFHIIN